MKRSWRRLTTRLRPAGSGLSAALTGQLRAALDGAAVAQAMVNKKVSPADARVQMAEIEHRGDEIRGRLIETLSHTLVAPLDREDLFRLSRSIDDILDTLRDFVREADLYQIENRTTYRPFLDSALRGIEALDTAAGTLWTGPKQVPVMALEAKKAAGKIGRTYQKEMAKILGTKLTASSFRRRELLSRLDLVGARINEAADVLTDGTLKRGY